MNIFPSKPCAFFFFLTDRLFSLSIFGSSQFVSRSLLLIFIYILDNTSLSQKVYTCLSCTRDTPGGGGGCRGVESLAWSLYHYNREH